MNFFDFLNTVGGLALFLYGMDTLGKGLEKASGSKLQQILEELTSSPIKAVLLGATVTAVVQSSSATTVMVIGFVNSGIMKLSQVVGIIMGANIGTTATSWILSLTGIESNNFLISMLKPTSFSPILSLIGVCFILFSKNEKKKNIGTIMVGFAILMFGMEMMSAALKPLAEVPGFKNFIVRFSNPLLGMMAGLIITAIIQSSSASVGILQALSSTGFVSYGTAIPIIMGQNIGTCVTAIISAIGANRNAKRASLIHLYFNLIGTVVFMTVFYSLNAFLKFEFLVDSINPAGIAVIHSIFNVAATLVLLPFSKLLVKLAYISIAEGKEEIIEAELNNFQLLDDRFLEQPSFAVEQCKNVTVNMAKLTKESLFEAIGLIASYDENIANKIVKMEDGVDKYEDALGDYLLKLNGRDLFNKDSKLVSVLLHSIGDFERISDHATNVMESAKEMHEKSISFSAKAHAELEVFGQALKDIIFATFTAFENEDINLARTIEPFEQVIDDLSEEIKARHINRLRDEQCTIELGFILSDIINNYERIADHCSNIAISLIQFQLDSMDRHEYLIKLRQDENEEFRTLYKTYKNKYSLEFLNNN